MKLLTLIVILILVGCSKPRYEIDQTLRFELFEKCMNLLPAGPDETVYNDWDEVVNECTKSATYMAHRCVENCPNFGIVGSRTGAY